MKTLKISWIIISINKDIHDAYNQESDEYFYYITGYTSNVLY